LITASNAAVLAKLDGWYNLSGEARLWKLFGKIHHADQFISAFSGETPKRPIMSTLVHDDTAPPPISKLSKKVYIALFCMLYNIFCYELILYLYDFDNIE
jgi:hypothetical protein